jgi:uncharacterized protein YdaU (DUF1376 family)
MTDKAPAFQFYAKDFLTGTATMSLAEVGAYVKFLAYQWDVGAVPGTSQERARVLGCTPTHERNLWLRLSHKFVAVDEGYRNLRLERERKKQEDFRALQSKRGKASARTRWGAEPQPNRNQAVTEPVTKQVTEGQPESNRVYNRSGNRTVTLQSSSSSSLKEQEQEPPPRPLIAGESQPKTWGKIHGEHVPRFCDWVCFPEFIFAEFARKSAGPEYVLGWAARVRADWEGKTVGDNLKFWRARWSDAHPEATKSEPKIRTAAEIIASIHAGKSAS